MTFGEKVKLIRESRNLSTTKLAKMAGIAQSTLRDIELGNSCANTKSVEKICSALNMTLSQIDDWDSSFDDDKYQSELLRAIKKLNNSQKRALLDFIRLL